MSNLIRDETREESKGFFESGGARGGLRVTTKRFSPEQKFREYAPSSGRTRLAG
jgi:hypothetical protein